MARDGAANKNKTIHQINLQTDVTSESVEVDPRLDQLDLQLEVEKRRLDHRDKQERIERLSREWRVNLRLRKQFAYIMVTLVGLSNFVTFFLLFLLGFKFRNFHLSDTVVVAVISATVAELASIFLIIIKYLFRVEVPPGVVAVSEGF